MKEGSEKAFSWTPLSVNPFSVVGLASTLNPAKATGVVPEAYGLIVALSGSDKPI
jgi:hypothetical protein